MEEKIEHWSKPENSELQKLFNMVNVKEDLLSPSIVSEDGGFYLYWTFKEIPELLCIHVKDGTYNWYFKNSDEIMDGEGVTIPDEILSKFDLYRI